MTCPQLRLCLALLWLLQNSDISNWVSVAFDIITLIPNLYKKKDSDSDSDNVYSTKIDTDTISGLQKHNNIQ